MFSDFFSLFFKFFQVPHDFTLTERDVRRFLSIFDRDKNGVLTIDEFQLFMKFAVCKAFISAQYEEQRQEDLQDLQLGIEDIMDGEATIEAMLAQMEGDVFFF